MTKSQHYKSIQSIKAEIFNKFKEIKKYDATIKSSNGAEKRIAYKNRDNLYKEITALNESKMSHVNLLKEL